MNEKKYYSNCCWVFMPNFPESDLCPRCKEHCEAILDEEMEEIIEGDEVIDEGEETSTEDVADLATLIEALQIFKKYCNPNYPTICEHDILYVKIDPKTVSKKDILKLEGRGFIPNYELNNFYSHRFGSA